MQLNEIVQLDEFPIHDPLFIKQCKQQLDENGALVLADFLSDSAIKKIVQEGLDNQHLAFFSSKQHNDKTIHKRKYPIRFYLKRRLFLPNSC